MHSFCTVIPAGEPFFSLELLGSPIHLLLAHEARLAGSGAVCYESGGLEGFKNLLIFTAPAPAVSSGTIIELMHRAQGGSIALCAGDRRIAVYCPTVDYEKYGPQIKCQSSMQAPQDEGVVITDMPSAHQAQESIRIRTLARCMNNGVMVTDMHTTHVSPLAEIKSGTMLLPSVLIYGQTRIGKGCRIGPNALLQDAVVHNNVKINSSQVFESEIGDNTAVGPFAYIRPGCFIDSDVKIGDFVELKKSHIGRGTKISHLTYIGDSEFGENINVGCGVVTVNYNGKKKHKTVVEDGSFIGCNVNLVAPVRIGKSAYVAAGSTITEDVEGDALALARARQVVKPKWVSKKRADGVL